MDKVFYLGYYAGVNNSLLRHCEPAGLRKMDYIWSVLERNGRQVEIVSASGASVCQKGSLLRLAPNVNLKYFATLGSGKLIRRVLSRWVTKIHMFLYLLFSLKKDSTVVAYHSLGYMGMIKLLRKLRKFKLILEVEEVYADVMGNPEIRQKELDFFPLADAYIFPTEMLDELVNTQRKPSVVVYGSYQVEEVREGVTDASDTSVKHLLYAGTFDPRKGGAVAAAEAAAHLPAGYHLHISGFGSERDKQVLRGIVERVNAAGAATVSIEGLLPEEEYVRLIQRCDVGFCTQTPEGVYNDTSFPSKVLSYLANGLRVVSSRLSALERSSISPLLYYCESNAPQAIADAVKRIDWEKLYDSRAVVRELDEQCVREVGNLLQSCRPPAE